MQQTATNCQLTKETQLGSAAWPCALSMEWIFLQIQQEELH
jgi:hypothetical protein